MRKGILFSFISVCFLNVSYLFSQGTYIGSGSVTKGLATKITSDLFPGCNGARISSVGTISSTDGKVWTVPDNTAYSIGPKLTDLYNECSGIKPAALSAVNLSQVPVTVIDQTGELITGYLLGDNYFELYINGVLVGVDPVPFTPFNSSVARFKVSRPYTIAIKLVDWEENLGLGTELNGGNAYHSGDGGFIAQFSDGTVTDSSWRAQTFYIAPVENLSTVVEKTDGTRSTETAKTTTTCEKNCFGIHYEIPNNWKTKDYNDKIWPKASLYTPTTVGANWPAYLNFSEAWNKARFIWSSNLILDNVVIVRKTVGAVTPVREIESFGSLQIQNPFSENISFQCDIPLSNINISLLDLNGKIWEQWNIRNLKEQELWQVPTPMDLPNGCYVLSIRSAETYISGKLIHQK
jgi:hypothetical protein